MSFSLPRRWWLWLLACVVLLCALVGMRVYIHHPPPGLMKDIRAGIAARRIGDPDARLRKYLDGRYGSMSDPVHRREAFVDFFNIDHIKALQLLVKHSPDSHRQENIDAMGRWIAGFRSSLTPEERNELKAQLLSSDGQAMLRRATAQYNSQDVRYRGNTAPVISQLLRTLNDLEQAR